MAISIPTYMLAKNASKKYTDEAIAQIIGLEWHTEVVDELPPIAEADDHTFYFVPDGEGAYTEYIVINDDGTKKYEEIGHSPTLPTIDTELDPTSHNAVENMAIANAIIDVQGDIEDLEEEKISNDDVISIPLYGVDTWDAGTLPTTGQVTAVSDVTLTGGTDPVMQVVDNHILILNPGTPSVLTPTYTDFNAVSSVGTLPSLTLDYAGSTGVLKRKPTPPVVDPPEIEQDPEEP